MRANLALFTVLTGLGVASCSKNPDDKTIAKELVGIWQFKPREQLPPDKIEDNTGAYMTPDEQVFQFGPIAAGDDARGDFVEYRHIPEHTNSADHSTMKARWVVGRRGRWFVSSGKVELQGSPGADFTVLSASSKALRVGGWLFPCKDGCVLRPLSAVPEGARSAQDR